MNFLGEKSPFTTCTDNFRILLLLNKKLMKSSLDKIKGMKKPERTSQSEKHFLSVSGFSTTWLYPCGCHSTDGN